MKLASFFFFLFSSFVYSSAQAQTYSIQGKVTDSSSTPIEYASLVLQKLPDSSQVAAVESNLNGEFEFKDISLGEYVLVAFQVSYQKEYKHLKVHNAIRQLVLQLRPSALATQEVTIEAQKPLVRQEPDKMVVDVESSVSNSGLTTLDVLRKSPGITVGKDGNISIKGKSGVQIMLDDKPLYMSESQLANLLKSIPSDQLKEIEIITSPSAKYDAVGSSGIINIRLKKAAYEGLTGSGNASYGQGFYYKSNMGVNVAYKKKKITTNAGYQYNNNKELDKDIINRTYLDSSNPYGSLLSRAFGSFVNQSHSGLFNGEYKPHKNHSISFDFTGSGNTGKGQGNTNAELIMRTGALSTSILTNGKGSFGGRNLGAGAGYKAKLDTNGTLLSFYANYNSNNWYQNRSQTSHYYDSLGQDAQTPYVLSQGVDNTVDQYSAKTDFTKQVTSKIKLETGAKLNITATRYVNQMTTMQNNVQTEFPSDFTYKEHVYAGYGMLNGKWEKWKAQAGIRIENTQVEGYQKVSDSTFTRNYTNFFPSGNLSFSPTKKTMFSLLYSRRIKRPEASHLNPVAISTDPFTSWGGNPYLLPQYSDNYELAYSTFGGILITTLSYSHNTNHISYALVSIPNTLQTRSTFLNMKRRDMIGLSFTVNTVVTKWWTTSNFLNTFYTQFEAGEGYESMNFEKGGWTVNSTQTLKLPKGLQLEFSGNYESPKAQNAFGMNLETWQANIGLSQKLWAGKGLAKIAFSDMFWTSRWATEGTVNNTILYNSYQWDSRVLMFTFTYKFGNKVNITQEK